MGVLGVLLAAGTGSRFEGGNKLLADLDGDPVVVRAVQPLTAAAAEGRLDEVVAVVGHEGDRVAEVLSTHGVETVENPNYREGQGTSVARGAHLARDRSADAVVFALGDMPSVTAATVRTLVETWRGTDAGIVVPTYEGRRGNPVLFDELHVDALLSASGDTGGRELFDDHPVERVAVADPGIHEDVDTVDDLAALSDPDE